MHKGQPQAAGRCRLAGGFCHSSAAAPLTSTEPRALASAQRQEGFSPGAAASLQAVASWAHAQYCAAAVAVVHRAGIARGWLLAEGQIAPVLLPVHQLGSHTQSLSVNRTRPCHYHVLRRGLNNHWSAMDVQDNRCRPAQPWIAGWQLPGGQKQRVKLPGSAVGLCQAHTPAASP